MSNDTRLYVDAFEDFHLKDLYTFTIATRVFNDGTPILSRSNHLIAYTSSARNGIDIVLTGNYNAGWMKDLIFRGPYSTTGSLDSNRMMYDWIQEKAERLSAELGLPIHYSERFEFREAEIESGNPKVE